MKYFRITFLLAFLPLLANGQVLISSGSGNPDSSSMLEIRSTAKGLLLPRIDFLNRPANPAAGLLIFVTDHGPYGNNALYFYNGSAWVKVTVSTVTPGDRVAGGVAFYVDPTGQHGYVAALTDQSNSGDWGCDSTLIGPGAQNWGFGSGQTNTTAIVSACPQQSYAAKICDTLTLEGYSDWFLPSDEELDSMYVHQGLIPNLDTWWYWSSTEADATGAMFVDFTWPSFYYASTSKQVTMNVRCIRKF